MKRPHRILSNHSRNSVKPPSSNTPHPSHTDSYVISMDRSNKTFLPKRPYRSRRPNVKPRCEKPATKDLTLHSVQARCSSPVDSVPPWTPTPLVPIEKDVEATRVPERVRTSSARMLAIKPSDGSVRCKICGVRFDRPNLLTVHLLEHGNERPFPCFTCNIRFTTKWNLMKHQKCRSHRVVLAKAIVPMATVNKPPPSTINTTVHRINHRSDNSNDSSTNRTGNDIENSLPLLTAFDRLRETQNMPIKKRKIDWSRSTSPASSPGTGTGTKVSPAQTLPKPEVSEKPPSITTDSDTRIEFSLIPSSGSVVTAELQSSHEQPDLLDMATPPTLIANHEPDGESCQNGDFGGDHETRISGTLLLSLTTEPCEPSGRIVRIPISLTWDQACKCLAHLEATQRTAVSSKKMNESIDADHKGGSDAPPPLTIVSDMSHNTLGNLVTVLSTLPDDSTSPNPSDRVTSTNTTFSDSLTVQTNDTTNNMSNTRTQEELQLARTILSLGHSTEAMPACSMYDDAVCQPEQVQPCNGLDMKFNSKFPTISKPSPLLSSNSTVASKIKEQDDSRILLRDCTIAGDSKSVSPSNRTLDPFESFPNRIPPSATPRLGATTAIRAPPKKRPIPQYQSPPSAMQCSFSTDHAVASDLQRNGLLQIMQSPPLSHTRPPVAVQLSPSSMPPLQSPLIATAHPSSSLASPNVLLVTPCGPIDPKNMISQTSPLSSPSSFSSHTPIVVPSPLWGTTTTTPVPFVVSASSSSSPTFTSTLARLPSPSIQYHPIPQQTSQNVFVLPQLMLLPRLVGPCLQTMSGSVANHPTVVGGGGGGGGGMVTPCFLVQQQQPQPDVTPTVIHQTPTPQPRNACSNVTDSLLTPIPSVALHTTLSNSTVGMTVGSLSSTAVVDGPSAPISLGLAPASVLSLKTIMPDMTRSDVKVPSSESTAFELSALRKTGRGRPSHTIATSSSANVPNVSIGPTTGVNVPTSRSIVTSDCDPPKSSLSSLDLDAPIKSTPSASTTIHSSNHRLVTILPATTSPCSKPVYSSPINRSSVNNEGCGGSVGNTRQSSPSEQGTPTPSTTSPELLASRSSDTRLASSFTTAALVSSLRIGARHKYRCFECGLVCHKLCLLRKHYRTHSNVRPFMCQHCDVSFKTRGNLSKHMKSRGHHDRCVRELGFNQAPMIVDDDTQIDRQALERQRQLVLKKEGLKRELWRSRFRAIRANGTPPLISSRSSHSEGKLTASMGPRRQTSLSTDSQPERRLSQKDGPVSDIDSLDVIPQTVDSTTVPASEQGTTPTSSATVTSTASSMIDSTAGRIPAPNVNAVHLLQDLPLNLSLRPRQLIPIRPLTVEMTKRHSRPPSSSSSQSDSRNHGNDLDSNLRCNSATGTAGQDPAEEVIRSAVAKAKILTEETVSHSTEVGDCTEATLEVDNPSIATCDTTTHQTSIKVNSPNCDQRSVSPNPSQPMPIHVTITTSSNHLSLNHTDQSPPSSSRANLQSITPPSGSSKSRDPRPYKCTVCHIGFRVTGHLHKHFRAKSHLLSLLLPHHFTSDTLDSLRYSRLSMTQLVDPDSGQLRAGAPERIQAVLDAQAVEAAGQRGSAASAANGATGGGNVRQTSGRV